MTTDNFDPLTSRVSWSPIRDLHSIARRSRTLLAGKQRAEVREAQRQIEEFRRVAFEAELESAIDEEQARLRQRALHEGDEEAARFFEIIVDGKGEVYCEFRKELQDELENLPQPDDQARLESVLEMIKVGLPLDTASLEAWTEADFLAAHSLALVEEIERELIRLAEPDEEDLKIQSMADELDRAAIAYRSHSQRSGIHLPRFFEAIVRNAFNLALEALDAVGRAELQRAEGALQEVRRQLTGQVNVAKEEATMERGKRRLAANAAVTQRHARTRALREEVLREWDVDRARFPSAERAGEHFADWLERRGFRYQQRTVRDWIRAHAKAKGVVLR